MELLQLAPETLNYHCPFNTSHTMPHKTLIKHIIKCPDRPPNYKNCIYNLSHVMPESELKNHEENCPNRILFDTTVYETEGMVRPIPIIDNVPTIEYDESWDGLEHTSDVLSNINKTTVPMKAKHGWTKSERKKHRITLHDHDISRNNNSGQDIPKSDKKSGQTGSNVKKCQQQTDSKQLFIGKRPHVLEN